MINPTRSPPPLSIDAASPTNPTRNNNPDLPQAPSTTASSTTNSVKAAAFSRFSSPTTQNPSTENPQPLNSAHPINNDPQPCARPYGWSAPPSEPSPLYACLTGGLPTVVPNPSSSSPQQPYTPSVPSPNMAPLESLLRTIINWRRLVQRASSSNSQPHTPTSLASPNIDPTRASPLSSIDSPNMPNPTRPSPLLSIASPNMPNPTRPSPFYVHMVNGDLVIDSQPAPSSQG